MPKDRSMSKKRKYQTKKPKLKKGTSKTVEESKNNIAEYVTEKIDDDDDKDKTGEFEDNEQLIHNDKEIKIVDIRSEISLVDMLREGLTPIDITNTRSIDEYKEVNLDPIVSRNTYYNLWDDARIIESACKVKKKIQAYNLLSFELNRTINSITKRHRRINERLNFKEKSFIINTAREYPETSKILKCCITKSKKLANGITTIKEPTDPIYDMEISKIKDEWLKIFKLKNISEQSTSSRRSDSNKIKENKQVKVKADHCELEENLDQLSTSDFTSFSFGNSPKKSKLETIDLNPKNKSTTINTYSLLSKRYSDDRLLKRKQELSKKLDKLINVPRMDYLDEKTELLRDIIAYLTKSYGIDVSEIRATLNSNKADININNIQLLAMNNFITKLALKKT